MARVFALVLVIAWTTGCATFAERCHRVCDAVQEATAK